MPPKRRRPAGNFTCIVFSSRRHFLISFLLLSARPQPPPSPSSEENDELAKALEASNSEFAEEVTLFVILH